MVRAAEKASLVRAALSQLSNVSLLSNLLPLRSTIESSPAIFSELLAGIGLPGLQVEEVYALDRDLLTSIQPIHGLIFLFPYTGDQASRSKARQGTLLTDPPAGLFAPTQVIQNACATQALLSIALNSPGVTLPAELSDLLTFTADFDATMKGLAISNSETVCLHLLGRTKSAPYASLIKRYLFSL